MATANTPRISLCVAMYKVAQYLPRFVESMAKQPNLEEMEFIFVNDASPDESEAVLRSELGKHPDLKAQTRIISHAENQGTSQTRQDSLEAARGTYVTWADPDDWVDPGMYQALADKADACQADYVWEDFYEQPIGKPERRSVQANTADGEILFDECLAHYRIAGILVNALFRKSFLDAHNIRFLSGRLHWGEDTYFLCAVFVANGKMAYLPEAHYHYVRNSQSVTCNPTFEHWAGRKAMMEHLVELARTEREKQTVHVALRMAKILTIFNPHFYAPYSFVKDYFPEIRDLRGFSCTRLKKVLFWVAVRNPFLRWVAWRVDRALVRPYQVIRKIRGQ